MQNIICTKLNFIRIDFSSIQDALIMYTKYIAKWDKRYIQQPKLIRYVKLVMGLFLSFARHRLIQVSIVLNSAIDCRLSAHRYGHRFTQTHDTTRVNICYRAYPTVFHELTTLHISLFVMPQCRSLRATTTFAYYFAKVLGFFPVRFNSRCNRFQSSRRQVVYSCALLVAFAFTYLTSGVAIISALSPLIAIAFTNLSVTTICCTLLIQCKHYRSIAAFCNQSKDCIERLDRSLGTATTNCRPQLLRIAFKFFYVNFMAQYAVIKALHNLLVSITGSNDFVAIFIVSMAYFMQTMVPNIFFSVLQVFDFYIDQINREVQRVVDRAKCVEDNRRSTKFAKTFAYCSCSDRLDELAELHQSIVHLLGDLNGLCGPQLLLNILNFFGIFVIEVICI